MRGPQVCENADQLQKFLQIRDQLPLVKGLIMWDGDLPDGCNEPGKCPVYTWAQFMEFGKQGLAEDQPEAKVWARTALLLLAAGPFCCWWWWWIEVTDCGHGPHAGPGSHSRAAPAGTGLSYCRHSPRPLLHSYLHLRHHRKPQGGHDFERQRLLDFSGAQSAPSRSRVPLTLFDIVSSLC